MHTDIEIAHFHKKYQQWTLKRTTVSNWKHKFSNPQRKVGEPTEKFNKKGQGKFQVGISSGNGVLKAKDRNSLSEFAGGMTLTENWARGILKSMDWAK